MITQKLKRWLSHLFAWWPWKHASPHTRSQSPAISNNNAIQETAWLSTIDGPESHPGIISIVIDDFILEADSFDNEEATDPNLTTPPLPPIICNEDTLPLADSLPDDTQQDAVASKAEKFLPGNTQKQDATQNDPTFSPVEQRRLAFLRYMVQQGILNEHGPADTSLNEDQ